MIGLFQTSSKSYICIYQNSLNFNNSSLPTSDKRGKRGGKQQLQIKREAFTEILKHNTSTLHQISMQLDLFYDTMGKKDLRYWNNT